jgi:hypothetical protein
MAEGHIRVWRKMCDWGWYKDSNAKIVFLHMLLKANWKDGVFLGVEIPRGSFVSSFTKIAEETGLSVRSVRTGIEHLESTNEITRESHPRFTVFTIKNYECYQGDNTEPSDTPTRYRHDADTIPTRCRHDADTIPTTIEERKNIKEILTNSSLRSESVSTKKNFQPPTVEDVKAYCEESGHAVNAESFVDFYESKGWMVGKNRMKDWKAAVRNWSRSEKRREEPRERAGRTAAHDRIAEVDTWV